MHLDSTPNWKAIRFEKDSPERIIATLTHLSRTVSVFVLVVVAAAIAAASVVVAVVVVVVVVVCRGLVLVLVLVVVVVGVVVIVVVVRKTERRDPMSLNQLYIAPTATVLLFDTIENLFHL